MADTQDNKPEAGAPLDRLDALAGEVGQQANALESWAEDLLTCYPDREHAHLFTFAKLIGEKLSSVADDLYSVEHELKGRTA
jgi:hypothetical protein